MTSKHLLCSLPWLVSTMIWGMSYATMICRQQVRGFGWLPVCFKWMFLLWSFCCVLCKSLSIFSIIFPELLNCAPASVSFSLYYDYFFQKAFPNMLIWWSSVVLRWQICCCEPDKPSDAKLVSLYWPQTQIRSYLKVLFCTGQSPECNKHSHYSAV